MTEEMANAAAIEVLKVNAKITVRKLAKKVGCSVGLIAKLPAWKALKAKEREMRPKKPPAVSFTPSLEADTADPRNPKDLLHGAVAHEEELARLIKEHKSDKKTEDTVRPRFGKRKEL